MSKVGRVTVMIVTVAAIIILAEMQPLNGWTGAPERWPD
jgi:hypothetical protein